MMVFSWANNVLSAGSICFIAFSIVDMTYSLPTTLSARPYPSNYTCTDCCDLQLCMGLDNGPLSTNSGDFTDKFCSKTNIAIMPTCFTKHNLDNCSYMKKLVSIIPSSDKMSEGFIQLCKQKGEMKAISSCLTNSSIGSEDLVRCQIPYMNALKDKDSDVCETISTMSQCVLSLLKTTNCSDNIGKNYEQSMELQKEKYSFCTNASAQMCNVLYIVIISLMLIWNKIALKI
ncbi:uncharacterized protein LOC127726434 [Mytilus californianus]|uniref:uncharacterized protein LOC127726434 n=1 Tax=Mytilus californianus TaxID=6549 RepID=UPI002247CD1F|nr:uncharacterized protein LOC127726434 [Mytilus californianus]